LGDDIRQEPGRPGRGSCKFGYSIVGECCVRSIRYVYSPISSFGGAGMAALLAEMYGLLTSPD
jgi:hypothetical protein